MTQAPEINGDFADMIHCLTDAGVEFLIVGAHALAAHGVARATGDIDILVRPSPENAQRVLSALRAFGAPIAAHGVGTADFAIPGSVYQIGLPPRRIDLLTELSGVSWGEAWATRLESALAGVELSFLGIDAMIRNKTAAGRYKDLADVKALERLRMKS